MKTKLQISIEQSGFTVSDVADIIGHHNEGLNLTNLKRIFKVLNRQQLEYPFNLEYLRLELIEDEGKLNVYENGKDLTYTIQENEYFTLDMVDENDKEKQIAGQDALLLNPVHERNKK